MARGIKRHHKAFRTKERVLRIAAPLKEGRSDAELLKV